MLLVCVDERLETINTELINQPSSFLFYWRQKLDLMPGTRIKLWQHKGGTFLETACANYKLNMVKPTLN